MLFIYLVASLKEINVGVSDLTYYNAINLCIENGYLPNEKDDFYKTLARYRNQASHTYKKPPFQVISMFYEDNLNIFEEILSHINSFIKSQKSTNIVDFFIKLMQF